MNLKKITKALRNVEKQKEWFLSANVNNFGYQNGLHVHVNSEDFDEISLGKDVHVVEQDETYEKHLFEYKDTTFFALYKKEPVASNPYGLTEQERDMKDAGMKESDFVE